VKSLLAVRIDGKELSPEEARALWQEFSAHLDEHTLDFAGFAKKKGWTSIKPEHRDGRALLVVDSGQSPKPQPQSRQPQKPLPPKPTQKPQPQKPQPQKSQKPRPDQRVAASKPKPKAPQPAPRRPETNSPGPKGPRPKKPA
jgi:hypothetical protein